MVLGGALVGFGALLVLAIVAWGLVQDVSPEVAPTKAPAPASTARVVELPPAPAAKAEADRVQSRGGEVRPYRVTAPFNILDGLTFAPENAQPTRIAGLSGPAAQAVCLDADGRLWACGLQARAALSRLTAGKTVECAPTGTVDGRTVLASCRIDGQDVARSLVAQGFARPADPKGPLGRVEASAREASLGLWNGRWQIR